MAHGVGEPWDAGPAREGLSALADGEVDAGQVGAMVSRWREDGDARSAWHAYQLIGDVLRSDDLGAARRDRAFAERLHARLAAEPVVLAPEVRAEPAAASRPGWSRRWSAPVGVAAGVALVAGTLFVTRFDPRGSLGSLGDSLTAQAPAGPAVQPAVNAAPSVVALAVAASSVPLRAAPGPASSAVLLRDARLDRYLAAHKQFQGANALGPTAGFIRSATYDKATR